MAFNDINPDSSQPQTGQWKPGTPLDDLTPRQEYNQDANNTKADYGPVAPGFFRQPTQIELAVKLQDEFRRLQARHSYGLFRLFPIQTTNPEATTKQHPIFSHQTINSAGDGVANSGTEKELASNPGSSSLHPSTGNPYLNQTAKSQRTPAAQISDNDSYKQQSDQFWPHTIAAGVAAGLAGKPIANLMSAAAKAQLTWTISQAMGTANSIEQTLIGHPAVLRASQFWEEHFGIADDGALLRQAAQLEMNLNKTLATRKEEFLSALNSKMRNATPFIAKTMERLVNNVLTASERKLLAGYWQITAGAHLNLAAMGVIPKGLDKLLENPLYVESCKNNGPLLLNKISKQLTPEEFQQFQQYHSLIQQIHQGTAPEAEQQINNQKHFLYQSLKVPPANQFKDQLYSLERKIQECAAKLKPEADKLNARLVSNPCAEQTTTERVLQRRYEFLKQGAPGTLFPIKQLSRTEAALVEQARIFRLKPTIANMHTISLATQLQMREIASQLKLDVEWLSQAEKLNGYVPNKKDKALLARFNYFRTAGLTASPAARFLTAEEAGLAARKNALAQCMGKILQASEYPGLVPPAGFWMSCGRGLMFAGAVQAGEDALEQAFSLGQTGHGNLLGAYAQAVGIPLVLSMKINPLAKYVTAVALGPLGSAADKLLPHTKKIGYSRLLTPSFMEEALIGLASGLPLRTPGLRPRIYLISGAMAAGKVLGLFNKVPPTTSNQTKPESSHDELFHIR